ncbi:hypothetical protein J2Y55_006051 [Bosea sp. BE125]|uniref:hypothetical protein n=1 Tax=Bosea sp. BE125 TaxID=2817909 RepID=UPI00285F25B6|nr:hypothetical protein [Bosea sp. BE125]MDR6875010.1 hypothetical protein [Bosea sp. BE125]
MRPLALLDSETSRRRLEQICRDRGLDPARVAELVAIVRSQKGKLRRRGLFEQFDELLSEPEKVEP